MEMGVVLGNSRVLIYQERIVNSPNVSLHGRAVQGKKSREKSCYDNMRSGA